VHKRLVPKPKFFLSFYSPSQAEYFAAVGTRPHRSYSLLRLPDWPTPFLATFGAATTPSHPEPPSLTSDHLPCMPCSMPRWTGSGAHWLASCAFPRGFLPCPCSLPR